MEQKGWCRVVEIRNCGENTQIEPIENDRVYIHRQSLELLEAYLDIGSVYEFRRLKKESDEYFLKWLEYKKLEEQGLLAKVVHGEWEDDTGCLDSAPQYKCSNCGKPPILSHNWVTLLTNFCPNCGAKMDGKKEGVV